MQPQFVVDKLELYDYTNEYKYPANSPEYRFEHQFKYKPIFIVPVTTALRAYCYMLISAVTRPNSVIYFDCTDYFEISMDEWHAMRRGDKHAISQIQSPIRETVISTIQHRRVKRVEPIPYYTNDLYLNYLMYCLCGQPYYTLCRMIDENELIIDASVSDAISNIISSDKYKPLLSNIEILDPTLFDQFQNDVYKVMRKE